MKSLLTPLGGTKFVLAFVSNVFTTLLCALGRIDGSIYLTVTAAVVGGYITGDVMQRKNDAKAQTP